MHSSIIEIFNILDENKEIFDIPIYVDNGKDVIPKIFELLNKYQRFIGSNGFMISYLSAAVNIVDRISEALQCYLQGEIRQSISKIKLVFEDNEKLGNKLLIESTEEAFPNGRHRALYKSRIGNGYAFNKEEMFHISFHNRSIIGNQRYSINGIPCVYLGTSSFVCWEELGRPNINDFWVSRFEISNSDMRFLNLSYEIFDVKQKVEQIEDVEEQLKIIVSYVLKSIIQRLCSISVKNKKALKRTFKEEYIFPQLIMLVIQKLDIDGVIYLSTKNPMGSTDIIKNIALPANDYNIYDEEMFNSEYYNSVQFSQKLREDILLTKPNNMGLVKQSVSNDAMIFRSLETKRLSDVSLGRIRDNGLLFKINDYSRIMLFGSYYTPYTGTDFYLLEKSLLYEQAGSL